MNPISALASSLRFGGQVPKRKVRGFSICSRTNCGKSAFSFRFGSESFKTNSEIQLPLFDLETEVPKRIVKSWVWLMTIRFGLATTTEWRKSTRTIQGPVPYKVCQTEKPILMYVNVQNILVLAIYIFCSSLVMTVSRSLQD